MKGGVPTSRLFVAVDPAPDVRDRVRSALGPVRALAPRARWVDPAAMHVTLAFLGDIAEDEIANLTRVLGETASRRAPMDVRFVGAGTFGRPRPRVLWVGLVGGVAPLGEVHRDLGGALSPFGYEPDHPDLTPHLTLARAGDRGGDPGLLACAKALSDGDFGPTRFDAMVLYQSELSAHGAKYTERARLPFSTPSSTID